MEKTSTFTLYSENCSTPFLTSSCSTAPRLGIRARKLPLNDQHRVAFLNREDCPFASQLLSGCPLPVALGPFHADFAPTDYSAHLWSAPDSSTRIVRWI